MKDDNTGHFKNDCLLNWCIESALKPNFFQRFFQLFNMCQLKSVLRLEFILFIPPRYS